jgi:hypothetical protein
MKNKTLTISRSIGALCALALPSVAFAMGTWDNGGVFVAPEFDAGAAGTVAAVVIGGAILIARRRRS